MKYWLGGFDGPPQIIEVQQNSIGTIHIHPTQRLALCDTADATIRVVDLEAKQVSLKDDRSNFLLFNGFSPTVKSGTQAIKPNHGGFGSSLNHA